MDTAKFVEQLNARIAKYDLLCHPFYQAWSAGKLSRDDLREYAQEYYHHIEALSFVLGGVPDCVWMKAISAAPCLANLCDEKGVEGRPGKDSVPHSELWLDFAEGMGSTRNLEWHQPIPAIPGRPSGTFTA